MKTEEFDAIVEIRLEFCKRLLQTIKGPEYIRKEDRLWNFKRAGELQGCCPEEALVGMWTKHLVSILDLVGDIKEGRQISMAQFEEKITDSINYHLLLEGLVKERKGCVEMEEQGTTWMAR